MLECAGESWVNDVLLDRSHCLEVIYLIYRRDRERRQLGRSHWAMEAQCQRHQPSDRPTFTILAQLIDMYWRMRSADCGDISDYRVGWLLLARRRMQ